MARLSKKSILEGLDFETILDLADWQGAEIDRIRGYASGMNREMRAFLGKRTLIDCMIQNDRTFHLNVLERL